MKTGAKIFVDTNFLIYTVSSEKSKCEIALKLINENKHNIFFSTQVINEFIYVTHRKKYLDLPTIKLAVKRFNTLNNALPVTSNTIKTALSIFEKYKYSYWDSLIISSALESNCGLLLSEDLQSDQVINRKLKIVNPFKNHKNI